MLFEYAIALTGGIATGKSTVVERLAQSGFRIIDADSISHELIDTQVAEIEELFGSNVIKNGKVNRRLLGEVVFHDKEKRKELEELLHPLIYKEIVKRAEKLNKRAEPYIIDIPLFYEAGRYAIEKVIVVYARQDQQIERLMRRDEFTEEEALARIEAQIDIEDKRENAMYVINNTGTKQQLEFEIERVRNEILGEYL